MKPNLYTSTLKHEALNILIYKIVYNNWFNNKEHNVNIHSINVIIDQNFFEFD